MPGQMTWGMRACDCPPALTLSLWNKREMTQKNMIGGFRLPSSYKIDNVSYANWIRSY